MLACTHQRTFAKRPPRPNPETLPQVVSLITIEVHARDVVEKLGRSGCTSSNDFEWVSQLRFYWDRDRNDCIVKQVMRRGAGRGGAGTRQRDARQQEDGRAGVDSVCHARSEPWGGGGGGACGSK